MHVLVHVVWLLGRHAVVIGICRVVRLRANLFRSISVYSVIFSSRVLCGLVIRLMGWLSIEVKTSYYRLDRVFFLRTWIWLMG